MNKERLNQIYSELENQKNSLQSMSGDIANIETRIDMLKEELSKAKQYIEVPMINRLLVHGSVWRNNKTGKLHTIDYHFDDNIFFDGRIFSEERKELLRDYTLIDTGLVSIADYPPPEDVITELFLESGNGHYYRISNKKTYTLGYKEGWFNDITGYTDRCGRDIDDYTTWRLSGTLAELAQEKLRGE